MHEKIIASETFVFDVCSQFAVAKGWESTTTTRGVLPGLYISHEELTDRGN